MLKKQDIIDEETKSLELLAMERLLRNESAQEEKYGGVSIEGRLQAEGSTII